ncbi:MAG: Serine/threonine protein kinase [Myxococcales bacterium]|nr:Serine/threonine protein kinase [Myxococcales bacterium]
MSTLDHTTLPQLTRFRIVSVLGGGAQGAVYEAYDVDHQLPVALKLLGARRPDQILRFKNEFRAVRDLRHPNLVTLGELFEEDGRWFFTMELVRGRDFITWVRGAAAQGDGSSQLHSRRDTADMTATVQLPGALRLLLPTGPTGPAGSTEPTAAPRAEPTAEPPGASSAFDEARLRGALRDLARAIAVLHSTGKVHRDLKPSNVLVEESGRLVLIDFGVVAELTDQEADRGLVIGTTNYMAPEQVRGEAVGAAADWYAFGGMLFEALTGRRPFNGRPDDVMQLKCSFEAPRARTLVADLPPDLEELCARLLARVPEERPSQSEILHALDVEPLELMVSRSGSGLGGPFVGRDRELGLLEDAYAATRMGTTVSLFVEGESGIGKSALASHFLERLRTSVPKLLVLRGRCHDQERVPYNAFDSVIDGVVRYLQTRPTVRPTALAALGKLFPSVRAVAPGAGVAPASGALRSERVEAFEAVGEVLRVLGLRRSLVILVEDLQWADADSLALLESLTGGPRVAPFLFLGTARAGEGGAPSAACRAARGDCRRIVLEPLPAEAAERLARAALDAHGIAPMAEAVVAETGGHPLFIDELVRHIARRGAASAGGLDEALRDRLTDLSTSARAVLDLVAVAGTPLPQRLIAAASTLAPPAFAENVATLRAARLVRVAGSRKEDTIEAQHDRLRVVVYDALADDERRRLHLRLAEVLDASGAGPELLATHFTRAGERARGLPYVIAAARAAANSLAFASAAELWRSALALGPDGTVERQVLVGLAEALQNDGRAADAAELFLRAAALAEAEPLEALDLRRRSVEQFIMGGHLERGLETAGPVLDATRLRPPGGQLSLLLRVGWNTLRLRKMPLSWHSRPAASVSPAELQRLDVCWSMGAGLAMIDLPRSAFFSTEGALGCLEVGEPMRICRALVSASLSASGMNRREQAASLVAAARRAAEEHGSDLARFYAALAHYAYCYMVDTDFASCLAGQPELDRLWRSAGRGAGWETDVIEHFCCAALYFVGRFREGNDRVAARIAEATRTGNRFAELTFRVRFCHPYLIGDRPDEGWAEVTGALAAWPSKGDFGNQHLWGLSSLVRLALYRGDVDGAAPGIEASFARCSRSLIGRLPVFRLLWWFDCSTWYSARALGAQRRGARSEAKRHARRAMRLAHQLMELGTPLAPSLGRMALGCATHAAGNDDQAREELQASRAGIAQRFASLLPVVDRRLGQLLGGDRGTRMIAAADAQLAAWGGRVPERLADSFLPW